jgi:MFS-type transporter involved in bile tolerance (Atg22 family)
MFHSQRAGVATVLLFLLVGGLLLATVNEQRGIAAARDVAPPADQGR